MNTEAKTALWVITPGGLMLARKLQSHFNSASLFISERLDDTSGAFTFNRLAHAVSEHFDCFQYHVFFMSTGIVVRMIADHIQNKTKDPAVVVVDDAGKFAISLLSGHLGGANELAQTVAGAIGAAPVITTATEVNHLPAIDMIAKKNNFYIENPAKIKILNMAFIQRQSVLLADPYHLLEGQLPESFLADEQTIDRTQPTIVVDDRIRTYSANTLVLRPKILSVGIGCNRDTGIEEIRALLDTIFRNHRISLSSVREIATIDIKKDEAGILSLADELGVPIRFYESNALNQVESVQNPSHYAKKHTGAKSVCEAAAILAANMGRLIIPKEKTRNVTIAIAREKTIYTSSV